MNALPQFAHTPLDTGASDIVEANEEKMSSLTNPNMSLQIQILWVKPTVIFP
jgi:hypothetical protein